MDAPQQMFQLIGGYWVTQIVATIARFNVADALAAGPRTAADVASEVGADPAALHRILRAAALVGVLSDEAGRFSLTPLGETLRSNVPGSLRDMAVMQASPGHWLPFGRIDEVVRTGKSIARATLGGELWEYYNAHPEEGEVFSRAMTNLSALVGHLLTAHVKTEGKRVVDVGGAHGTLLSALVAADPGATGVLLDLPHVVETARGSIAARGLADRIECVAGDFFAAVPSGDFYVLKQILHDWNDDECVKILTRCAESAKPGARLLVVEMLLGVPGPAPLADVVMLVLHPGRERTEAEMAALFTRTGWTPVRTTPLAAGFWLLEAERS